MTNSEREKSSTYTKLILKNGSNGAFVIGGGSQLASTQGDVSQLKQVSKYTSKLEEIKEEGYNLKKEVFHEKDYSDSTSRKEQSYLVAPLNENKLKRPEQTSMRDLEHTKNSTSVARVD